MRRAFTWPLVILAGLLIVAGGTLAMEPKARAYARYAVKRIVETGQDLVDPPKSVEALQARLFDPATAVAIGPPDAPTVVAFVDYNCVFCRREFKILEEMAAGQRAPRVLLRHLPHSADSLALAEAMLAAKRLGGGPALHRALAPGENRHAAADLPTLAAAAGLDPDRLLAEAAGPEVQSLLDADIRMAWELRIRGTPALIIAGRIHRGVKTADQLADLLAEGAKPAALR